MKQTMTFNMYVAALVSLLFLSITTATFANDAALEIKPLPIDDVEKWFNQSGRNDAKLGQASDLELLQAQVILKNKGLYAGKLDALYGPKTAKAIKAYQQSANLKLTGQLDKETYISLTILPCLWLEGELRCSHPECSIAKVLIQDGLAWPMISCPSIASFLIPTSHDLFKISQ
jgi:hypothetical protein